MSRSARITLEWGDGDHPFALKLDHLAELQEKTGAGPWYMLWSLERAVLAKALDSHPPKDMSPAYVTETLRLGLIGGGMTAVEALQKVRAYAGPGQLTENIASAYAVLGTALQGVEEDLPGKDEARETTPPQTSLADGSGLPNSTASGLPLV